LENEAGKTSKVICPYITQQDQIIFQRLPFVTVRLPILVVISRLVCLVLIVAFMCFQLGKNKAKGGRWWGYEERKTEFQEAHKYILGAKLTGEKLKQEKDC
jgi:hypothetical protein